MQKGNYQAALKLFSKALLTAQERSDASDTRQLLERQEASIPIVAHRATTLSWMGRLEEAQEDWLLAYNACLHRPYRAQYLPSILSGLSDNFCALKQYDDAVIYAEESVNVLREQVLTEEEQRDDQGSQSVRTQTTTASTNSNDSKSIERYVKLLDSLDSLARVYSSMGRKDDAIASCTAAHELARSQFGKDHPITASHGDRLQSFHQADELKSAGSDLSANLNNNVAIGLIECGNEEGGCVQLNGHMVKVFGFDTNSMEYSVILRGTASFTTRATSGVPVRVPPHHLRLQPNTPVILHSLTRSQQHNLHEAIIESYNEPIGRYRVRQVSNVTSIEPSLLSVRPTNILALHQGAWSVRQVRTMAETLNTRSR